MDGPPLGIIMLEAAFHRPPGDVGHPATWPFPVLFDTVPGATPDRVVRGRPDLDAFIASGRRLVARGAAGLLTSCGFLAAHQRRLAAALPVPLACSSLLLLPLLARCQPGGGRVGVLTYDRAALGTDAFAGVGADPRTPVAGLPPDGAFHAMIERGARYDRDALEVEAVVAARSLLRASPEVSALVLECTNLPPFADAIARATGRQVHDVVTLGRWLHAGLATRRYAAPA